MGILLAQERPLKQLSLPNQRLKCPHSGTGSGSFWARARTQPWAGEPSSPRLGAAPLPPTPHPCAGGSGLVSPGASSTAHAGDTRYPPASHSEDARWGLWRGTDDPHVGRQKWGRPGCCLHGRRGSSACGGKPGGRPVSRPTRPAPDDRVHNLCAVSKRGPKCAPQAAMRCPRPAAHPGAPVSPATKLSHMQDIGGRRQTCSTASVFVLRVRLTVTYAPCISAVTTDPHICTRV